MRRGDVAVLSISSVLAGIVVAAVTFSVVVLDRTPEVSQSQSASSNSSWLVITWGPSLCKVDPANRGCTSGHVEHLGRTWILHGLWPQPADNQFCGVPEQVANRVRNLHGSDMPSVDLKEDVRHSLQSMMSDAAVMAPHEWYTHGTCSDVTPDAYFGDAATLTDQARDLLDPIFQAAQGKSISLHAVRDKFDQEFGDGAGDRVHLSCRSPNNGRRLAYELHLSLPRVTDLSVAGRTAPLADLLLRGPTIAGGCREGRVP